MKTLRDLSMPILFDFAVEYGKPLWKLIMALEDVSIYEFERIKEFGIRITQVDQVYYSILYKGELMNVNRGFIFNYLIANVIK